jgi:hypothetical protein
LIQERNRRNNNQNRLWTQLLHAGERENSLSGTGHHGNDAAMPPFYPRSARLLLPCAQAHSLHWLAFSFGLTST